MSTRWLARVRSFDPLAGAPRMEREGRALPWALAWVALLVLVAMSAFHLWTGTAGEFTAGIQRSVHLTFALGLAFLIFPARVAEMLFGLVRLVVRLICLPPVPPLRARRERALASIDRGLARWQTWRARQPLRSLLGLIELTFIVGSVIAVAYLALYYEALVGRQGRYTQTDLIVGGLTILFVLEATRRVISPALSVVALVFLAYALYGHLLPGDFGHAPLSLRQLIEKQYAPNGGIFGVPLRVSSTFVFLFVLFGAALERTGAGRYLIDLAFATMGRFRGGPAKAAVMASGLMGTVSGSSIANTVTTGSLTIPLMKKVGFKPHVAGAVEVAASTNGQLMPPVMGAAAFIMADYTGIAYQTIIIAALLPAVLSYTVIFTMVHLEAVRTGMTGADRSTLPALWRTLLRGVHLNIPFAALLWFLLYWWYTPSYSAALAIWVALGVFVFVSLIAPLTAYGMEKLVRSPRPGSEAPRSETVGFLRRTRHFGVQSTAALRDGAMNMIGIACACACCGIIVSVVESTGLASRITTLIATLSGDALFPALMLTALACIVLGIGLPTTATYIIMAALIAPALFVMAAPELGSRVTGIPRLSDAPDAMALVLATHLFVFYYGILADDTPPVGLCAYAAAGIAGADPLRTGITSFRLDLAAFLLPFIFFYNRELLLIDVTWTQVLWVLPGALLGMICFAMALQGYAWSPLRWWQRILLAGAAFLLVKPEGWMTAAGVVVALVVIASGRWLGASRAETA